MACFAGIGSARHIAAVGVLALVSATTGACGGRVEVTAPEAEPAPDLPAREVSSCRLWESHDECCFANDENGFPCAWTSDPVTHLAPAIPYRCVSRAEDCSVKVDGIDSYPCLEDEECVHLEYVCDVLGPLPVAVCVSKSHE
jgi:hypothetical protein